jgi:hypothetical protein
MQASWSVGDEEIKRIEPSDPAQLLGGQGAGGGEVLEILVVRENDNFLFGSLHILTPAL